MVNTDKYNQVPFELKEASRQFSTDEMSLHKYASGDRRRTMTSESHLGPQAQVRGDNRHQGCEEAKGSLHFANIPTAFEHVALVLHLTLSRVWTIMSHIIFHVLEREDFGVSTTH